MDTFYNNMYVGTTVDGQNLDILCVCVCGGGGGRNRAYKRFQLIDCP